MEALLKSIYYDPSASGSFGGARNLVRASNSKRKTTKNWLESQDVYTLHRARRRQFPRRKTIVGMKNTQYQLDLIDLKSLAKFNDGFKYILTCVDVFSKFIYALPIKNKTGKECARAFERVLKERKIRQVSFDRGGEFYNSVFLNLLKKYGVKHFSSYDYSIKGAVVERFNKTLMSKLYKMFTRRGTYRYLEVLPEVITSYNRTPHSSIGVSPLEVNRDNREDVFWRLYERNSKPNQKPKLDRHTLVRISQLRNRFQKGYRANFTEEIFKINKAVAGNPPVYKLRDYNDREIHGIFYYPELSVVRNPDDVFLIEKILSTRTRKKKTLYLVKWLGYGDEFNSWVEKKDLKEYIN